MKKKGTSLNVRFCHVLAAAVLFFAGTALGQGYKVTGVSDVYSITVLDEFKRQIKVRLAGIDAAERGQDFANRPKHNLSRLILGKQITLEGEKIDRCGRRVAKVVVSGLDVKLRTFTTAGC